jgi:hypothetical protein
MQSNTGAPLDSRNKERGFVGTSVITRTQPRPRPPQVRLLPLGARMKQSASFRTAR